MPGSYDFARAAYFQGLGAVGFALSAPRKLAAVEHEDGNWPTVIAKGLAFWLAGFRHDLTLRILGALPGSSGAIAAALLTGERGAIPDDIERAFRDSGLAHILSISGLHLALVAGILFFAVRGLLALSERVALNYPIKKWAAATALIGAFAYLLLSGAAVATQRAFIMAALVLVAVMLDRAALSMRSVAWAALAVLVLAPESLLDAGFQMSFAAVVALIAVFEAGAERFNAWRSKAGLASRALQYIAATALTTLVAGLASAPFAVYHFNRFVDFSLIANVVGVPLTSLWVMPWGMAALALMPFHWEGLALIPMGLGIDGVVWIAQTVAAWPGAVSLVPAMPFWGLLALTGGGLWLCLWRRVWRLIGLGLLVLGGASPWLVASPDVLVDCEAKMLGVKSLNGGLMLSAPRGSQGLVGETWLRRAGLAETEPWPRSRRRDDGPHGGASEDGSLRCDSLGCIYRARGRVIALPRAEEALAEDCRIADAVVAVVPVRGRCPGARIVVDRFDIARNCAHALWIDPDGGLRVENVRNARGERPWTRPWTPPWERRPAPSRSSAQ
jgi:competence protein ComEC